MAIQMCRGAQLWLLRAAAWSCTAAQIDDAERRSLLFRAAAAHFTETPAVKLPTLNSPLALQVGNFH
jgi:hypothetical protein